MTSAEASEGSGGALKRNAFAAAVCLALLLCACGAKTAPVSETESAAAPAVSASAPAAEPSSPAAEPQENAASAEEAPEVQETETAASKEERAPAAEQPILSEENEPEEPAPAEEESAVLQMKIGEVAVAVGWEENEAVAALRRLCRESPLRISMEMYGGFEQVGPLGASLPRNDAQTVTAAGDIVLYSGDQLVVFYGSNSWSYTRLGHITDKSAEELAALLGNGNVTVTLSA